jgi:hypothetical protein
MSVRNWTPEQRQRQAEKIRAWSPWERSTGPRTPEGNAATWRNAWKGGHRALLRELSRALAAQKEVLNSCALNYQRAK